MGGQATTYGEIKTDGIHSTSQDYTKEALVASRQPIGSMNLFNPPSSYVTSAPKKQNIYSDVESSRLPAPHTAQTFSCPSIDTVGIPPCAPDRSKDISDRNNEQLLDAFKSNPYTHSLTNVA